MNELEVKSGGDDLRTPETAIQNKAEENESEIVIPSLLNDENISVTSTNFENSYSEITGDPKNPENEEPTENENDTTLLLRKGIDKLDFTIESAINGFQSSNDDTPSMFGVTEPVMLQVRNEKNDQIGSLEMTQQQEQSGPPSNEPEQNALIANEQEQTNKPSSNQHEGDSNKKQNEAENIKSEHLKQDANQNVEIDRANSITEKTDSDTAKPTIQSTSSKETAQKDIPKIQIQETAKEKKKPGVQHVQNQNKKAPKEIPAIPISSPKRPRSIKEQKEAAERLSKTKPIVSSLSPEQKSSSRRIKIVTSDHYMSSSRRAREIPDVEPPKVMLKAPPEFIEMITKKSKAKKKGINMIAFKHQEKNSTLTSEEISALVDVLVAGRKKSITDPATIADVINELTNRRIQAMREFEYVKALKFKTIADDVRTQFRLKDREIFHQEYLSSLKDKLAESKLGLKEGEKLWKSRMKELKASCQEEISVIESRHTEEMQKFEDFWRSPEAARRFSKKSPQLLTQLTIEKNMALTGDLIGAARIQKTIKKNEQTEASQRYVEMKKTFLVEQQNLLNQQANVIENIKISQSLTQQTIQKQYDGEIETLKRRVSIVESIIEEESDLDKFCAKKFKHASDVLVPMSVTINGGGDIPTSGKTRAAPRNTSVLMSFRESSVSSPLQLPTLKIVPFKPKNKPKKKAEDEF